MSLCRLLPRLPLFALLLLLLSAAVLPAQQRFDHIWYFGNGAGVDFRSGTATSISGGMTISNEGTAVATDPVTQNLVFYTDGVKVWDSLHRVVVTGLAGASSSTQSALIVPVPGTHRRYYIFTTAQYEGGRYSTIGMQYSIVDFHSANPLIVRNVPLLAPGTEKVTAIGHCNGSSYWIITHGWNSNAFYCYLLTNQGLDTHAVISRVGPLVNNGTGMIGYLAASPDGAHLAMANWMGGDYAGVFTFDNSTGRVGSETVLMTDGDPYGICFSPDGSKVYVGVFTRGWVMQFDLTLNDTARIRAERHLVGSVPSAGAIMPGVDGRLYITGSGNAALSVIDSPNVAGVGCSFRLRGLPLTSGSAIFGLPNVVCAFVGQGSRIGGLGLPRDTALCAGQPVQLQAFGADVYEWSPPYHLSCPTCPDPLVTTDTTITYVVTGYAGDSTCVRTDTITVHVDNTRLPVDARGDSVVCPGAGAQLIADVLPDAFIRWWSDDTLPCDTCHTLTVHPVRTTTYYLDSWMRGGCRGKDSITVRVDPNGLRVKGAGTTVICPGGVAPISVTAPPGAQVLWSPITTLQCDTCSVAFARPQRTTTYHVVVIDSTGCRGYDSVTVIVDTTGLPVVAEGETTVCPGSPATLAISTLWSGQRVRWTPSADLSCDTCLTTTARPQRTTVYRVEVTDERGCRGVDSVTVTVDSILLIDSYGEASICDGGSAVVGVDAPAGARVQWSPSTGLSCDSCSVAEARPPGTTVYHVEVTDSNGCRGHDSVRVVVLPLLTVATAGDASLCPGDSVTISVALPAGARVRWTPGAGLGCDTCATTPASPTSTTIYRPLVQGDEACYLPDSVLVIVDTNGLPVRALGATTICAGSSATLVADLPPDARLRWSSSTGVACDSCRTLVVSPMVTTVYHLKGWTDGGCRGADSVIVRVDSTGLQIDALGDAAICVGDSARLLLSLAPPSARIRWTPSAGLDCDTCRTVIARPLITTVYHVHVVDTSGCSGGDSVVITVNRPPTIALRATSTTICEGEGATLTVDAPPGSRVRWTPASGPVCDTCTTTSTVPTATTLYHVEVTDPEGCQARDSILLSVIRTGTVTMQVGGSLDLRPGTAAELPLSIAGIPPDSSVRALDAVLQVDPRLLTLISVRPALSLAGWEAGIIASDRGAGRSTIRLVRVSGSLTLRDGMIATLEFDSYYGGVLESVVEVSSVELVELGCTRLNAVPGHVRLDSLCGMSLRQIELLPFGGDKIVGVSPHPVDREAVVELTLVERKSVELVLVDELGREGMVYRGELGPGRHEVRVVTGGLASGRYRLVGVFGGAATRPVAILVLH